LFKQKKINSKTRKKTGEEKYLELEKPANIDK